jgi:DNA-binding PadR family transcriptional regulator
MPDRLNLAAFLPLTPVSFEILLALAGGEQHGYAVMLDIERRTGGAVSLHAGSLYRALNRLLEAGLIEELDERPDPDEDDERRRYYRLTAKGLQVARGEARRLEQQVEVARQRRLLTGSRP